MDDGDWLFAQPCSAEFTPRWFQQHERTILAEQSTLPSISRLTALDELAPSDWAGLTCTEGKTLSGGQVA